MLLTVFKALKPLTIDTDALSRQLRLEQIRNRSYTIQLYEEETGKTITGVVIQEDEFPFPLLIWQTYSMNKAKTFTHIFEQILGLEPTFEPISFNHDLFKYWIGIGSQIIECAFDSSIGETKITGFNLKHSKQFKEQLDEIQISMMVFTLEKQDVLITARQEGRLSITPDISYEKLVAVLETLLPNGIAKVVS